MSVQRQMCQRGVVTRSYNHSIGVHLYTCASAVTVYNLRIRLWVVSFLSSQLQSQFNQLKLI